MEAPLNASGAFDPSRSRSSPAAASNRSSERTQPDALRRVSGLSIADFAAQYWAIGPLLRRAAELPGHGFDDLLSLDAVDELVSRRGLRTPFVRMTRAGEVLPARRFTRGGGAGAEIADQVADDKVLHEFAAGATLVLQGLHRVWPPVQQFAADLAAQLGHPVQVNAYVTPPENTGFAPHYDVHDVFVLQFAGRKHWRVHEPVLPAPLRDQPWDADKPAVAARAAEAALLERVLEPGDALYLPRGYLHSATALGEISGHLTVGVHPVTRHALATELFATLANDLELRRSLPLGADLNDPTVLATELTATVAALHAALDRVDPASVARGVGRHLAASTRPAPLRPLQQLSAAQTLLPGSRVRLRPGLRLTLRSTDDACVIELPDRQLRIPAIATDAVRAATTGSEVAADGLPGLDIADSLGLLQRLLREAIVVPA